MDDRLSCKTVQGAHEYLKDQQTDQSSAIYDLEERGPQGRIRKNRAACVS